MFIKMKIKSFEQINKEDMEYRRPCQIGQFLKDLLEDEDGDVFAWKKVALFYALAVLVVLAVIVWGIVLLVK